MTPIYDKSSQHSRSRPRHSRYLGVCCCCCVELGELVVVEAVDIVVEAVIAVVEALVVDIEAFVVVVGALVVGESCCGERCSFLFSPGTCCS